MSLWIELQRRNVLKVGVAYLIAAWLLIQVAATLAPQLHLPEWAPRLITLLLMLGFPIALLVSWFLEHTPEGLRVEPAPAGNKRIVVVAVALAALAIGWFLRESRSPEKGTEGIKAASTATAPPEPGEAALIPSVPFSPIPEAVVPTLRKSIAVLPFVNMSSDPEQEYFSDGMTEEVLNALAQVPGLQVTARTSVFALKGERHDARELGVRLGVAYLLEGSVRKAGDDLRITAQLIRADDGFHLWSNTYDRKLASVFALQAEIAGAIASALELPLGLADHTALVAQRTADPQAYALYLKARAGYRARGDGIKRSIALYREALARDPAFAPAWAGLAGSLAVSEWYLPPGEAGPVMAVFAEAEDAAKKALSLSPDDAEAHIRLGQIYTYRWEWAAAERAFQRALELAPDSADAWYGYGALLTALGRSDEDLRALRSALALDPLVPIYLSSYGAALRLVGRFDEAIVQLQAARALGPGLNQPSAWLMSVYLADRRYEAAERLIEELEGIADPGSPEQLVRYRVALRLARNPDQRESIAAEAGEEPVEYGLALAGDLDAVLARSARRIDQHSNGADPLMYLRSRMFDGHRDDPRYVRLMARTGLADMPVAADRD